ncbi:restriction endonuclease subunit S [Bacillus atrophaeus]|uniref:restriction endonuclease subunit S n=1 Tax=Bacillus atrophaeus TaxID=1452 RepID=UPI002DC019A7|nr:restriction endonuclease subunit S [Bacillus atrophaeus]MEC0694178.1 restriction endonuclease subunit S [Bacillus atrophaeus]
MSKKKKTIDELLEEALVPEAEQPYEIPDNWIWSNAGAVSKVLRGVSYKKHQVEDQKNDNNLLVLRGGNIQDGTILNQGDNVYVSNELVKEEQRLQKNDVVIVSSTGSSKVIGKAASVINEFVGESFGAFLTTIRPSKKIDSSYFGLYYQTTNYRNVISSLAKGSNINNIKKEHLDSLSFPQPPLDEQKRIVEKVESLLGKVEEAKQLIEEAKETFELRRAAILDKAFRGELSKGLHVKEKNENNEDEIEFNHNNEEFYELPYNWRWVSLESVCETITDGDHQAPPKSEEGIPFLVISNINKGVLDFQKTRFVPKEYYNKLHAKRKPKVGDVLYSVTGSYGIPVLVDTDKEFCFQRHIAILKPNEDICSKYLYYILKSRLVYNQATNYATGTAQLTVPLSGLRKIKIPLPSLNEQNYIVGKIERMFNKQAYAEKFCIISNENIEVLKQSILSKAFKGELGTNNPSEENAIELLKQVLQEQVK